MEKFNLYIKGAVRPACEERYFESINPATAEPFALVADASVDDMREAVTAARESYETNGWAGLPAKERGQALLRIAQAIRDNAKRLAELESLDTGKTIKQTTFIDIPACADTFEYFSGAGDLLKGRLNPVPAPVRSFTEREPWGVVACIIPWNYPLIMFAWKVAPALLAGNSVVFKPSQHASVSVVYLAGIIRDLGLLPDGVLNIVTSSRHDVTQDLIENSDVRMISFTGGTETGRDVMARAARTTKKVSLELGGKSPNIVFADCDMDAAVGGTMSAIFMNQGQMCTAGSRLLLEDAIYDEFLEKLVQKTRGLKIGNSISHDTDFGPLISQGHRAKVLSCIQQGLDEGARVVCGGGIPSGLSKDIQNGFYLEPTIFTGVDNSMTLAREEIFGPVLAVIKFSGMDHAVKLANDSPFGLASCVWTKSIAKANQVSRRLQCGIVWVNTYGGFYNEASFGGYKQSGVGRELGEEGLLEYTQSKHVCVDVTPGGRSLVTSWF
ncbi:MAG TPA: aldehyde dehydrogenase family protein [Candidatus Omnitrophota bacterium]|nr:aldehyde dehydrogenase family protein [Candidatus Omnitrophota bacterium]HQO58340.1 aldehyde dehydrogenase family protein [Candidatus Omnitrophota bacterium]HQP11759.1 aldehyde dehydrogenase family protein [Candidatus Omnitrophota bacterium]